MDLLDNNIFIVNRIKPKKIYAFTVIITVLLIMLIFFCCKIKIKDFYKNKMIISNTNGKYISLVNVFIDDIDTVLDNSVLYVGDKKYEYDVSQIGELGIENNRNMVPVIIIINDFEKYQINNLILEFRIENSVQSIISCVKNLI